MVKNKPDVLHGDLLPAFTWTGTAADLHARLEPLAASGVTEILHAHDMNEIPYQLLDVDPAELEIPRQPFRCDVGLKRLQAGAQLCQLFIDGRIFAQWTIKLGPLIEATNYARTWSGNPQNSMDVIGQAITLAITRPSRFT